MGRGGDEGQTGTCNAPETCRGGAHVLGTARGGSEPGSRRRARLLSSCQACGDHLRHNQGNTIAHLAPFPRTTNTKPPGAAPFASAAEAPRPSSLASAVWRAEDFGLGPPRPIVPVRRPEKAPHLLGSRVGRNGTTGEGMGLTSLMTGGRAGRGGGGGGFVGSGADAQTGRRPSLPLRAVPAAGRRRMGDYRVIRRELTAQWCSSSCVTYVNHC